MLGKLQKKILNVLYNEKCLTIDELAEKIAGHSRGSIATVVITLEKKGLVRSTYEGFKKRTCISARGFDLVVNGQTKQTKRRKKRK